MAVGLLALPAAAAAAPAGDVPRAGVVCYNDGGAIQCYPKSARVTPPKRCYEAEGMLGCYWPSARVPLGKIPDGDVCSKEGERYVCAPPPPMPEPPPPPNQSPTMPRH